MAASSRHGSRHDLRQGRRRAPHLHSYSRVVDPPIERLEVENTLQLSPDAGELLVRLENFIRLVVLQDVDLDQEDPPLAGIGGREHGFPLSDGGQRLAVTRGLEGVVTEQAELDVISEELIHLFDGLALQTVLRKYVG